MVRYVVLVPLPTLSDVLVAVFGHEQISKRSAHAYNRSDRAKLSWVGAVAATARPKRSSRG